MEPDTRSVTTPWYLSIPGMAYYSEGKTYFGIATLSAFACVLLISILQAPLVIASLSSFVLTVVRFIVTGGERHQLTSPEIFDWWSATFSLFALPLFLWWRNRVALRRRRTGQRAPVEHPLTRTWRYVTRQRHIASTFWNILALYGIALLAPYVSPHHPTQQQDISVTQYKPPLSSVQTLILVKPRIPDLPTTYRASSPFVRSIEERLKETNARLLNRDFSRTVFVDSLRVRGDSVFGYQKGRIIGFHRDELDRTNKTGWSGNRFYPLGTDRFGRDVLSRVIYGARISLGLALFAILLSVFVGVSVGLFSGYFEGRIDSFLMRTVDLLLAFPTIFLILISISLYETIPIPRIALVILILGLTTWMGISRLVRGQVLTVKHEDYILAAKALGYTSKRIIFRHILPNVLTPVIVHATLRFGTIILLEAALSFLNLGVQAPMASWGNIIYEGKDALASAWWISTFPGVAIVMTVLSFNLFGDGLRDALDPRTQF